MAATQRVCARCRVTKPIDQFPAPGPATAPYHPGGRSIYCYSCLEIMAPAEDLQRVDALMRWLDWPLLIDKWTQLFRNAGTQTLESYRRIVKEDDHYAALDWEKVNEKWKAARETGTLDNQIAQVNEAWLRQMELKWPSELPRVAEDYSYLENLYNDLNSTQNITTATQRDDAKRICELGLLINKKIRAGADAKNEMAMYHNIIKTEGFEPKNSKNANDFDSVGELYTWLSQRGWKPDWHVEPQDSVDFTIKNIQNFLRRLVQGEGNLPDQVDEKRRQLRIAEQLESEPDITNISDIEEQALAAVEYEGEDELDDELGDDECLN